MQKSLLAVLTAACLLAGPMPVYAESATPPDRTKTSIRDAVSRLDFATVFTPAPEARPGVQASSSRQGRHPGLIVLGAALGSVGGLFAGGYLGAAIEGDSCHCDDPGLMGALIGAPIGAVTGGILGGMFLFR